MAYAVYTTESFEKEIKKLSDSDKDIIQKIFLQLKENPYVGDSIRYRFFREKRVKEKRIYYLIYDDLSTVLVVAFGGKKAQQETIDRIIEILPEFRIYLEKLIKSKKPTGF
jgi:mRNA-degrading endonuclease RelE of RelBE toxin-antitoxin system